VNRLACVVMVAVAGMAVLGMTAIDDGEECSNTLPVLAHGRTPV
jgi:hypothetical protein